MILSFQFRLHGIRSPVAPQLDHQCSVLCCALDCNLPVLLACKDGQGVDEGSLIVT